MIRNNVANKPKKNPKNVPLSIKNWPYKSSNYQKSNGKPELQMRLSQNYDFGFTNLLKNETELDNACLYNFVFKAKSCILEVHFRVGL